METKTVEITVEELRALAVECGAMCIPTIEQLTESARAANWLARLSFAEALATLKGRRP